MQGRSRKRSAQVTLVLLGAAALGACSGDDADRRDVYRTRADCVQDWGDEKKCEPARDGQYASSYWYGPRYGSGYFGNRTSSTAIGSTGARPGSHAVATHSVSRGGFGACASSHSSGG